VAPEVVEEEVFPCKVPQDKTLLLQAVVVAAAAGGGGGHGK